jgi:hypothetical protein
MTVVLPLGYWSFCRPVLGCSAASLPVVLTPVGGHGSERDLALAN